MLTVKILGSGCPNCRQLEAVARDLVRLMPPYVWLRCGRQAVMYTPQSASRCVRWQLRILPWSQVRE